MLLADTFSRSAPTGQPLKGWREEWERERKMWMIIGCGMRLWRMRHGYVKKICTWTEYYYYHHHQFKLLTYPCLLGIGQQSSFKPDLNKGSKQFTPALYEWCVLCLLVWSFVALWLMGDLWATEISDIIQFLIVPNDHIITAQFFSSLSTSRCYLRARWAGHIAHIVDTINASKILVRKPERKRMLNKPRGRSTMKILNKLCHVRVGPVV